MTQVFNVYCDESCHLEKDCQKAMVLGAVWCPLERTRQISVRIREIKVDYFFDDDDLHFRALIAPDKSKLRHDVYSQTHDDWYYKMYFDMLKVILQPDARYRIYLDYKDTQGAAKVAKLHDVLCNNMYDFSREIIERVQLVRSHEVEILQLADLLIGTVSYVNRGLSASAAKTCLVDRMRERSGYALTRTTLLREDKVNLFRWRATEIGE